MKGLSQFIQERTDQAKIGCKTLLITLFGDVISQHGSSVWLGSLIETLQPFGYSERLVRTSVFRLVKDDWLKVRKIGRKSYYSLTDNAKKHYTKAACRIYSETRQHDDDRWLIVMPSFVADSQLTQLKKQLKWLGFSSLSTNLYAHPYANKSSLDSTLRELELTDSVIIFSAKTIDENSLACLKKLIFEKWNLIELERQYDEFIEIYQSIYDSLHDKAEGINNQNSFLLRLLVIHEYRRTLLKDSDLSKSMLSDHWSGYIAHQLTKKLYAFLSKSSQQYITSTLKSEVGFLPKADAEYYNRFGEDHLINK